MTFINKLISTFFYVGFLPKLPGTFGTLAGAILYFFINYLYYPSDSTLLFITIVIIVVSIVTSHYSIEIFNSKDPLCVVIDEVAGIFVAMLFVPFSIINLIIAFFLFRLFDVWKPLFVRTLENLPGGLGITMDDVGAGLISNLLIQIMIY
jgi:phosphatidylglycerophosphatase A